MTLLGIAWRNIRQRLLTSGLTALSLALGVALVVATLVTGRIVNRAFESGSGLGYNMIVGAKGSPLQLVLNSVYLISKPIENVPWAFYQEFLPAAERPDGVDGTYAASTQTAVPICMGDYYRSHRVVGTSAAFFDRLTRGDGRPFEFSAGTNFRDDDFFGGVLGAAVAANLGLEVGDEFAPTHGADDGAVHDPFKVVGILARTATPIDRGGSGGPQDSIEVGGEECRAVGVGRVECKQAPIEPCRFDERRRAVRDGRILLGLPRQELLGRAQGRRVGGEFKDILGRDHAPLSRGGKLERVAGDHVPHRRPVGIGHRAGSDERRPLGDGQFFERGGLGECGREPAANLADDCGQIPRGDRREVVGRRRARRALREPPAVVLKKAPRPVRLNRPQHGPRLGRRRVDRGSQLDEPFRIVRRPVTRRGEHPRGDRPGRLRPGLLLHGRLLDARERLGRRLRLAFIERLLHPLPCCRPGAREPVFVLRPGPPHRAASKKNHRHGGHADRNAPPHTKRACTHVHGPPIAIQTLAAAKSTRFVESRDEAPPVGQATACREMARD